MFFGLFGKKKTPSPKTIDWVWMEQDAKFRQWQADFEVLRMREDVLWLAYFPATISFLEKMVGKFSRLQLVKSFVENGNSFVPYNEVRIMEHYPLLEKESTLLSQIAFANPTAQVVFYNSLDEAWLKIFVGSQVVNIVQKMGLAPHEILTHSLITASFKNAQKKISEKVSQEITTDSIAAWVEANLPA